MSSSVLMSTQRTLRRREREEGEEGKVGGRMKRRKERGKCMCDMWRWLGVMEGPCVDVPHETKGGGVWLTITYLTVMPI